MRTKDEILKDKSKFMRERTGEVTSVDPLVAFLYLLARNDMPVGAIEELLGEVEVAQTTGGVFDFTNGYLSNWAKDARQRLLY